MSSIRNFFVGAVGLASVLVLAACPSGSVGGGARTDSDPHVDVGDSHGGGGGSHGGGTVVIDRTGSAVLGHNPFAIDGAQNVALLAGTVNIPSTNPNALTAASALTEEDCLGAGTTNLVTITAGGGVAPAACSEIDEVWALRAGLLVRMRAVFDVSTEEPDENGNMVGTSVDQERLDAFILVDYETSAVDLVGLSESSEFMPNAAVVATFFGETDAGKLIFEDSNRSPVVYEPFARTHAIVHSEVFGAVEPVYVTGNFLIWRTETDVYQIYDTERRLRFSFGDRFIEATALSGDIALTDDVDYDGSLFDLSKGEAVGSCPVRGSYPIERCTPEAPCFGGHSSGAIMMSPGCDAEGGGYFGICHVSPTCELTTVTSYIEDTSVLALADPNFNHSYTENVWVKAGTSYYVYRTENRLHAIALEDGEVSDVPVASGLNLAYFTIVWNTVYYAGETASAEPIYRAYDIITGETQELTRLQAQDRIIALRR